MRALAFVGGVFLAAGCGGSDTDTMTIFLRARLGPDGPHGQRAAILTPVERERRSAMSPARRAVLELLVGPAPDERARGFQDTIPLATRLPGVRVVGETAVVDLAGREPDFDGTAAIVCSVTGGATLNASSSGSTALRAASGRMRATPSRGLCQRRSASGRESRAGSGLRHA